MGARLNKHYLGLYWIWRVPGCFKNGCESMLHTAISLFASRFKGSTPPIRACAVCQFESRAETKIPRERIGSWDETNEVGVKIMLDVF